MIRRPHLCDDQRGVALVEFAIVAPVMLLMVFGLLDLTFQAYIQSTLNGAVNSAARKSTLEANAGGQAALDAEVEEQIHSILPSVTLQFQRLNYTSITDISSPERHEENGLEPGRQLDECFFDYNGNGQFDANRGRTGQGGADDFVQYEVTATYQRLFPMEMFGLPPDQVLKSASVLRNQPYTQQTQTVSQRVCS